LKAREKPLGGGRWCGLGEDALQSALGVGLRLAATAGRQVREHPLAHVMPQFSVHQRGETVAQVLFRR
jgi:hypothetical protein